MRPERAFHHEVPKTLTEAFGDQAVPADGVVREQDLRQRLGLGFTDLRLHVEVEVDPGDAERVTRLLASAKKHCLVANALRPSVTLDVAVVTSAAA